MIFMIWEINEGVIASNCDYIEDEEAIEIEIKPRHSAHTTVMNKGLVLKQVLPNQLHSHHDVSL